MPSEALGVDSVGLIETFSLKVGSFFGGGSAAVFLTALQLVKKTITINSDDRFFKELILFRRFVNVAKIANTLPESKGLGLWT